MTIESYLSRIADALEAIAAIRTQPVMLSTDQEKPKKQKEPANVPVTTAPSPVVPAPVVPPVSVAPAPVAANPTPVPVQPVIPTGCPFNDAKGLIAYVMDAYKNMGPTKGAMIQDVLTKIGVNNINDVQPKDYQVLWSGIEELKK